jgi:DNA-binding response OmpR family regulator
MDHEVVMEEFLTGGSGEDIGTIAPTTPKEGGVREIWSKSLAASQQLVTGDGHKLGILRINETGRCDRVSEQSFQALLNPWSECLDVVHIYIVALFAVETLDFRIISFWFLIITTRYLMRILFVEDDESISATLTESLAWHFVVDNAYTGAEALELLFQNAYDLVLLDYSLPDVEGSQLYEQIKAIDQTAKVLILTGHDEPEFKITMLDAGAEDYVTKPFHIGELMARIRVVLRRGSAPYSTSHCIGAKDLVLDTLSREVTRGGELIRLRRKEFDLLEYLLHNKGRVVTRDMILNHVWESPVRATTNTVDVHIKNLRDRIERPYPDAEPLILTVPGVGYKLDT